MLLATWAMFMACAMPVCGQNDGPSIDDIPVSRLLKDLQSDNRGKQVRAAQSLAKASAEVQAQLVPKLIVVLKSERENDRFVAAQTLGTYGKAARAAVPEMLPLLLGTQFERNRAAAAKALGEILKDEPVGDEVAKVVDALITKIDSEGEYDKYTDVRREAVTALGMIGPAAKKCIPKLVRVMTEFCDGVGSNQDQEYRLVRRAAAWTCGRMGPLAVEHVDLLISRMHTEGTFCPETVEALGLIGPLKANMVPNIMDAIERGGRPGDYGPFKAKAFEALGRYGERSSPAIPLIRRLLKDTTGNNSIDVKKAILRCLSAMGPAAKEALPEIHAHIAVSATKDEAKEAYKAVSGQDPA